MILTIIIFLLTLVILVVIHELGHFLMAKKFNIRVEEFGFGIPPRIFGKKIGETLVSLNALPLGGFVRLLGEDEVKPLAISESTRDFRAKSVWQRIIVVGAGVLMNLILAWLLFYIVLMAQDFKIVYPIADPEVTVQEVEDNSPAQAAGIKKGDQILKINGKKITTSSDLTDIIKQKKNQPVTLETRDQAGNGRQIRVTPQVSPSKDPQIGIAFSVINIKEKEYKTPLEKIFSGITYSWDLTKLTFIGLGKLFNDLLLGNFQSASNSVSGPVGLAGVTGGILKIGLIPYLWFVGIISLTLTIFNILPIPALDGGRLFFLMTEALIGKKLKAETEKLIHTVGFAVLIALSLLVAASDIRKFFPS